MFLSVLEETIAQLLLIFPAFSAGHSLENDFKGKSQFQLLPRLTSPFECRDPGQKAGWCPAAF